ncbi:MAG: SGNH/GDSL hydrolase family protein [Mollicutes bacterium]|nr:SGNH/GDSL hydrolase family protein [Mollicutes bacterium]
MSSEELDDVLPKYEPIKLSGKNLAQNYVSAFNTGMNIYQCVNYLQGNIDWTIKAVNDVVKSWNTEVSESIDQSKAIVRETTTEQFNVEWTNKQPELIEQVNTLTTNQFNEDWGVLENRINTTLETQNTNIQNIQNEQNELETNTNNNINAQNTKINSIQTQQTNLASEQTNLASQQTTLSNRMDTFTRLSEGSTTGDAELQDIRVGANGITYNNAGDAVRGQYTQLKEDLVNKTILRDICIYRLPRKLMENNYIMSQDITKTQNGTNCYCIFDISENDELLITGYNNSNGYPLYIFANENGKILSASGLEPNTNYSDNKVIAPKGATIVYVNGIKETYFPIVKKIDRYTFEDMLNVKYDKFTKTGLLEPVEVVTNHCLGTDGTSNSNSLYRYNKYINNCDKTIKITGVSIHQNYPLALFYDNNKLISAYYTNNVGVYDDEIKELEITIPKGTVYFVVQGYQEESNEYSPKVYGERFIPLEEVIKYDDNSNPLAIISHDGGMTNIFKSIGCIGDSLTFGGTEWDTYGSEQIDNYFSYPSQLQRMLGNKVINMGWSGATATNNDDAYKHYHDWITVQDYPQNRWLSEENKCQAYIIALGTNDIGYYGSFDGDISTDINELDCTLNAKTSVGGYARIIQSIKTLQPRAKIFCVTLPYTRHDKSTLDNANGKIKAIANKFGCYVIDLQSYYVKQDEVEEFKRKYYYKGHLNCLGYLNLSRVYATYIDWIIRNNPNDFYDVPIIEYQDYN